MKFLFTILLFISLNGFGQTRLYFSSTEAAPVTNVAFMTWDYTSEATRWKLNDTKGSSTITIGTQIGPWTVTSGAANQALDRQYVSTRMAAGISFSGATIAGQLMVREYANTDNVNNIIGNIRIVSEDGTTVRATIASTQGGGGSVEFISNASHRNKKMFTIWGAPAYTTVEGDRVVIEIGYAVGTGSGTSPEASAKWGEDANDLPLNDETQTTNGAGWIQFSNNITFIGELPPPPPPPITFVCGFECGISEAHSTLSGAASFNTNSAFVRSGNRSLHINPNSGYGAAFPFFDGNGSTYVVRAYIYFPVLPATNFQLIDVDAVYHVITTTLGVHFNAADNKIYAAVGYGFGANGVPVTAGQWYKIDLKVSTLSDIWTADVKVNDVSTSQATGTFTAGDYLGNVAIGATMLGPATTYDCYVDDLMISTSLTDYPFAGGNIYPFVPTSDNTHNITGTADFRKTLTTTDILNTTTDAYQLLDELPIGSGGDWVNMLGPPNATDYVQCKFGPAPGVTLPAVAPNGISVVCAMHQASTGTGNMEIRLNDNGITDAVYSATGVAGTTSIKYVQKYYPLAPSGGPWTITGGAGNFNNLKIQFGSPSTVDVNPNQYFDGAIIEANFPSSASGPPRRVRLIQ